MKFLSLITLTSLMALASCGHFQTQHCSKEQCHKKEKMSHCQKEGQESCHKEKKKESSACKDHCDKKAKTEKKS